jgi:predicted  nucleic acid-binding Zn ribbon protein
MKCPCCGGEMLLNEELEKTILYKCSECGLSDSRLKAEDET